MNGKHRAKLLSDPISELQRYVKQGSKRPCPELPLVQQALAKLFEARDLAKASGETEPDDENADD
jgi:hypothetical protein